MGHVAQVAVVGCGYWGKNLVRNLADLGALTAICDADSERLSEFSTRYNVRPFVSLADVLAADDVEAVVVATPAETHRHVVEEALCAGKDVFVEKPLALTAADATRLVSLAEERGRVLMVGHLLHYHGAVRQLKELVIGGALGRVQYIYSNRLNLGKIRREENILWSFAPHDVSVMLSLAQELPDSVACQGGNYLHARIADVTVSTLNFPSGLKGHVFVSWLHPYKEQRLVVVGDRKMAVFNDLEPEHKLLLYPHDIEWRQGVPVPIPARAEAVSFDAREPLREECLHFLECVASRRTPLTDGHEGLRVLRVLQSLQQSMDRGGATEIPAPKGDRGYFVHPTATVDFGARVGRGTKIWHYTHLSSDCSVGEDCNLGQNVFVASGVRVGNGVKIQNNVSLFEGVELEDSVFCGPSVVFTNVVNPRSHVSRKAEYRPTPVRKGATLGANATIVCGHEVGAYAFVGAGAVVTRNVPAQALVVGNPARQLGWVCACGVRLADDLSCPACGARHERRGTGLGLLEGPTPP